MFLMAVGVVMLVLKLTGMTVVATLSWWWILLPLALAAAWWSFADASGLTRRRAMAKDDARVVKRRAKQLQALGLDIGTPDTKRRPPAEKK